MIWVPIAQWNKQVLARIFKVPVWNSNHSISAYCGKKIHLNLSRALENVCLKKGLVITPKNIIIENSLWKFSPVQQQIFMEIACPSRQAGQVLAKSWLRSDYLFYHIWSKVWLASLKRDLTCENHYVTPSHWQLFCTSPNKLENKENILWKRIYNIKWKMMLF